VKALKFSVLVIFFIPVWCALQGWEMCGEIWKELK
jgi:hypothetical protein